MKVLYVKNGSDRDKKFQLQTIIYEDNGRKYVKKSVLCDEALPHLYNMYDNYIKLSNSIINPKVKLAKIVEKDDRSLTFEYIDGVSLAKKFKQIEKTKDKIDTFIQRYIDFLKSSFKMSIFDSKSVNDKFKEIFGNFDYSLLDGEVCFDGISNIDLIFSNIIYKDDEIYIIDYEWVFEYSLPIYYTIYRTLKYMHLPDSSEKFDNLSTYKSLEEIFIKDYVYKLSFNQYNIQYSKIKISLQKLKEEKKSLEQKLENQNEKIKSQHYQIEDKNKELNDLLQLADSMRIKNRIKKLVGLYK